MTNRITAKHLLSKVAALNDLLGFTREPYSRDADGKLGASVGTFVLDQAYGGYRLCQIVSDGGAQRELTGRGTARETSEAISGVITGVRLGQSVYVDTSELHKV